MTLVEFLDPLSKGTHQDRVLAVLYYRERYEDRPALTVDEIRQALQRARAKNWRKVNVADVLSKSGALVDTSGVQGRKHLWSLTDPGRDYVRNLLGLPDHDVEVEHDVGTLEQTVSSVGNDVVRHYLEEALKCLQVGALRACVVFVWSAAIRTIQEEVMKHGAATVTSAVQKHDPKARQIKKVEDFAYVKDATTLLAALELGFIDKTEKDTLTDALNLRNRCGHPTKYKPGVKKVSAFVEDVTTILFD